MDEELLRHLNFQLRDLMESMKIMGGNSDRVVSAIAKLAVQMEKKISNQLREQDAIEKFVKGVDKATASIQENRQAQQQLQDEADAAAAELEKLADTAKDTGEQLEKQNRIRKAAEDMRESRRNQWREKEITTAGQLISEYEKGAGVTQMLRDRLETVGGTSLAMNVSARMAVAGLQGFGKSLVQYAKAIYEGEQGALVAAKAVTTFADEIGAAAMAIGTAMMFIPGLGIATKIAGGLIAGLGAAAKLGAKATELAAEQSDRLYGSFVELTKSGVTSSDGMLGLADSAQRLGYGLDQVGIQAFNALMQSASRDLAMLSGSAAEGRRSFSRFSGEIVRSDVGRQLMMMGLSVDDINTGVAGFIKQQVSLGRAQVLTQRQLREESAAYVRELDAVTKLTGIQKQELESQMDANRRNERFRAAIERVRMEQGDEAARNLELNMAVASERFPGLSEGLKDIAAGFINTEAAAQVFRAGMGNIPKLMTRGLGTGFQEMGQAAQRTTQAMGSLAAVGAYGPVFGNFYESLKAAGMSEQDAAKRALEIVKEQEKGGDAAVAAQVDLRRSQMNTRDALQSFVKEGVNPATRALQKLAGIPEAAAGTLPGETPGGEMTGTAGGGGVLKTIGRYLQDLGLGPRAGRTESTDQPAATETSKSETTKKSRRAARSTKERTAEVLPQPAAAPPVVPPSEEVLPQAGGGVYVDPPLPKSRNLEDLLIFKGPSGTRESFLGLKKDIQQRVIAAAAEYNSATDGKKLTINSARRSSEDQQRLWQESVKAGRPGIGPNGMPIAKPGRSSHERGLAIDINEYRDQLAVEALNRAGLFQRVRNDPVHFSLARGGIASGPESGYPATLHGDEAVVPLPDGRTIPVNLDPENLSTSITRNIIPSINSILGAIGSALGRTTSNSTKILGDFQTAFAELQERSDVQNLANIQLPAANLSMENIRPDIENTLQQSQTEMLTTLERYLQRSTDTTAPRTDAALLTAMQELIDLQRKSNTVSERLLQASTS